MIKRAHGIDISQWQGTFDPTPENLTDIDFVILKITQSGDYVDPGFSSRNFYTSALKVPIRGGYHFYRTRKYKSSELLPESSLPKKFLKGPHRTVRLLDGSNKDVPESIIRVFEKEGPDWMAQAEFFLETVKGKDFHFFALDIEFGRNPDTYIGMSQNLFTPGDIQDIKKWIEHVKNKTGKPVLLYTNPNVYNSVLLPNGGKILSDLDLWLAAYTDQANRNDDDPLHTFPISHRPAASWYIWQYSADGNNKGKAYGASSRHIDLNVFNGSVEDLRAWLGLETKDLKSTQKVIKKDRKSSKPDEVAEIITTSSDTLHSSESKTPSDSTIDPVLDPDPSPEPVSDPMPQDGLEVEVSGKKAVLQTFKSRDKAGKPIMKIHEPRIRLDRGSRLIVSLKHSESKRDKGDGVIHATGNIPYYFISDHPSNDNAAGLYVRVADVEPV